jgi:hypothetical protein
MATSDLRCTVLLVGVLLAISFAPSCDCGNLVKATVTNSTGALSTGSEGKVFYAENPDGTTSIIGNWFTATSFTLSLAFFGAAFMLACIATAAYYVLMVVTEPSQQLR